MAEIDYEELDRDVPGAPPTYTPPAEWSRNVPGQPKQPSGPNGLLIIVAIALGLLFLGKR